ncbi:hypothetical protein ABK040_009241 [Willaertia magna]
MFINAIVKMIRETNKNQIEDSEAFQAQKQTIIKISIAVVALGICVIVRIIGVAIYAINIPSYVTYPLIKAIPDGLFAVCVCLLFWPYRLPILSQPIKFIKTEFKYVKVELEKKKNNHLNNLTNLNISSTKISENYLINLVNLKNLNIEKCHNVVFGDFLLNMNKLESLYYASEQFNKEHILKTKLSIEKGDIFLVAIYGNKNTTLELNVKLLKEICDKVREKSTKK